MRITILAPDSMHDEKLIVLAGNAAEGVIVTTVAYDPDSKEDHISSFVGAYRNRYGASPNNYAAHGYDAMMILAQAISKVGYDSEKIRVYLYQLKDYQGVAGNTSFDSNGDVIKLPKVTIVLQGQFQDYE